MVGWCRWSYFCTAMHGQIVKHEWPSNWESFIPDLCAAARTHQSICENCMVILTLLSEEVFDFGKETMTSKRVSVMMSSLTSQFQQIYDLCMFVMQNFTNSESISTLNLNSSLLTATLQCLAHFLKWIPQQYIFETGLMEILLGYFWDPTPCRTECVR